MSKYDSMTLPELFVAWVGNWRTIQTGIREIVGDSPMPDPREMARVLIEMPEEIWVGMFEHAEVSKDLKKQMDIQKLMAEVQLENVQILDAALKKGEPT